MILTVWMWKYSLGMYVITCDTVNASELLYIVLECFSIQKRLVYTETSVNNYFSNKQNGRALQEETGWFVFPVLRGQDDCSQ